jgi:hypothetical protein
MAVDCATLLGVVAWFGMTQAAIAASPEPDGGDAAVEEIIGILRSRGLIDESEATKLVLKHRAAAEPRASRGDVAAALTEGLSWYGDLRLRYESFHYDEDSTGADTDSRYRFRYRGRIGFEKKLYDWLEVGVRLASGTTSDPRSTNQSLGSGTSFDRDPITIDRFYAQAALPEWGGLESRLAAGKIANPFVWGHGLDAVVWDVDFNPEGAALLLERPLGEHGSLFANLGAMIEDENAASKDPKLFAVQAGGSLRVTPVVQTGARLSLYEWRDLDADFLARGMEPVYGGGGNLANAYDQRARIGDLTAFVGFTGIEGWPVTLFGTVVRNFEAEDDVLGGVSVDDEDMAWGGGLQLGDKRRWVQLQGGWYHVEANSVLAQFTDSDLFDGFTNREGWMVQATRELKRNVDLRFELLDSDSIENATPFATSVEGADRKRMRFDLELKF